MRQTRYVVLGLWLLISVMYFSLAGQWIVYSSDDKQFVQYVQHVVQIAAADHRPAKEVRTLLLVKAEELSIPLQYDQINITGEGDTLRTVIYYDTELKIPVLNHVVYRMEFTHDLNHKAIQ
jgi:hypothetical protein